ncbi:amino acid ABC transporter permease [Inquilinus sp. CAU 1745]|uniref:amino acid ABC transporter permease n=1 Tax=Inquilinus sp. CAU 1745 TaxID=3140369 RepID=UPI00325BEE3B
MIASLMLLLERPSVRWLLLFAVTATALSFFDFGAPLPDIAIPIAAGAVVVANFRLLGFLKFRAQVAIVWAELLGLFLLFFYSFDLSYDYILERGPILLGLELGNGFIQGAVLTLYVCFISIAISTVIALAAALARLSKSGPAFGIASFYISFFRGTPLLLQVMLIYLGLPQIGIVLEAIPAGVIALSLCYGAYMAEIFRAGILAVGEGQTEAALALGLRPGQVMRLVVLPQAMRLIVPPTGNQFISMLKDSSLVSIMGVWELMYLARTHGRAEFKYMEMLIAAALIYWAMSMVFELIQARIEKRFGKGIAAG